MQWLTAFYDGTLLIELIYSAELFPHYLHEEAFLKKVGLIDSKVLKEQISPVKMLKTIRRFNNRVLRRWKDDFPYTVVGISATYHLMPSLFFAAALKKLHPNVQIVFGGAQCIGEVGEAIARTFPFLDWVVVGEGEMALLDITRILESDSDRIPPSTFRRENDRVDSGPEPKSFVDISCLPYPDFDDYFATESLARVTDAIDIPVEATRGCWWGKCVFCNYELRGHGCYRRIPDKRVVGTMEYLSDRYKGLNFRFVDSVQPTGIEGLAVALEDSPYDFDFYMSLRPDIPIRHLERLVAAGLRRCHFGIESFSADTLRRMNKGIDVMTNILALREANRLGIDYHFNIISPYPGESRRDDEANREVLRKIEHLIGGDYTQVPFQGLYRNEIYRDPKRYGVERMAPARYYSWILPPEFRFKPTLDLDYRPKPTRRRVFPVDGGATGGYGVLAMMVGGKKFCRVFDGRGRRSRVHSFEPPYSDVLVACQTPRRRKDLKCKEAVLQKLMKMGLLIESEGRYLSLPMRV